MVHFKKKGKHNKINYYSNLALEACHKFLKNCLCSKGIIKLDVWKKGTQPGGPAAGCAEQ